MSSQVQVGGVLPLFTQLASYGETLPQYVRAFVEDPSGNPISGSPFALTAVGSTGKFRNVAAVMPNQPWIYATYLVYDDAGFTTLSSANGASSEIFWRAIDPSETPYLPPTSNIVAFVGEGEPCVRGPVEDTIVQGAARLLTIRLAQSIGGAPLDLTDATEIVFRMRNDDGSILEVSLDDTLQIASAGGGQIVVGLSAAQTLALAPAIPAPATIVVTIDAQDTVINLPTQLAVEEAAIPAE